LGRDDTTKMTTATKLPTCLQHASSPTRSRMLIGVLHKKTQYKERKTRQENWYSDAIPDRADDAAPGANQKILQAEIDHDKLLCRFQPRQQIKHEKTPLAHCVFTILATDIRRQHFNEEIHPPNADKNYRQNGLFNRKAEEHRRKCIPKGNFCVKTQIGPWGRIPRAAWYRLRRSCRLRKQGIP